MVESRALGQCGPREPALAWLHIPKTGSSLATALFHHANRSLPISARLPTCTSDGTMLKAEIFRQLRQKTTCKNVLRYGKMTQLCRNASLERCQGGQAELSFFKRFPLEKYFRCSFWEHADGNFGSHIGIDDTSYRRHEGRFVGMFRSPKPRVVSSYLWFRSSWPEQWRPNASGYARRVIGTSAKMLAGQADGLSCGSTFAPNMPSTKAASNLDNIASRGGSGGGGASSRRLPQPIACDGSVVPNVRLALHRLRRGFAFVGLTEEWALSICLFHAALGGACHAVEFENARPSPEPEARGRSTYWSRKEKAETLADVDRVADPYDEAVYAAAKARFWRDVSTHKLTSDKCTQLCPAARRQFATRRVWRDADAETAR